MSTSASKPAIVLVHGAWHTPEHWADIPDRLRAGGHEVVAPALVSSGSTSVPDVFEADVSLIQSAIEEFTLAGKDVVMALHSYGGVVGSEAVARVFHNQARDTSSGGKHGRVVHLFFIAALILPAGVPIAGDDLNVMATDFADGIVYVLEPYNRFYNCTPPPDARRAIGLLEGFVAEGSLTPPKFCGWADHGVPVTYLAGEKDMAVRYEIDVPKFVERLEKANPGNFTKKVLACDHTPWLSQKEDFMAVFVEVLHKAEAAATTTAA